MVAGQFTGQTREDLGLAGEAPKGTCVENAGAIARERSAIRVVELWMLAAGKFTLAVGGDADRQQETKFGWQTHPEVGLGLVIPQRSACVHRNPGLGTRGEHGI